jgi:hypothetical protein
LTLKFVKYKNRVNLQLDQGGHAGGSIWSFAIGGKAVPKLIPATRYREMERNEYLYWKFLFQSWVERMSLFDEIIRINLNCKKDDFWPKWVILYGPGVYAKIQLKVKNSKNKIENSTIKYRLKFFIKNS